MNGQAAIPTERTCKLARVGRAVDDARRFAELAVPCEHTACREAAAMVAAELAENIIKYGAKGSDPFAGSLTIARARDRLRIRATNEVSSLEAAQAVLASVRAIAQSDDVRALYRSRLATLFTSPGLTRAQLGLLRVAFEGGFKLEASCTGMSIVIVAERQCAGR
jgi:hypothetical protein